MLEVINLSKSFKQQQVLRGVHLQVGPEIKVIIGLNGSGKSTLLKIIAGTLPGDDGKVIIDGQEVTTLPPEKRGIGYVPQHPALFNHLTAWHNITYPLRNGRGSWEMAEQVVGLLGIAGILAKRPRELSGGYKSRVSLARALASKPKIMLLDEPLSDVDAATKEKLLQEFREVLKSMKIPILYVTHDVWEAELIGDTFGVMIGGKLVAVDSAREALALIRDNFFSLYGWPRAELISNP